MCKVYEERPTYENEKYLLKLAERDNWPDLLKVYSDKKAVPLFNSDNCHGDMFYYDTPERMKLALDFWAMSYEQKYFVRWAITDKTMNEAIGTIELFRRTAKDYFTDCGLLRLDLRSDYEKEAEIESLLSLITSFAFDDFVCSKIATKAIPQASERIEALNHTGFHATDRRLIGNDGTEYSDYFVMSR